VGTEAEDREQQEEEEESGHVSGRRR